MSDEGAEAARERARERFSALGEIAAEVAHELRNILQVISTSAYVARLGLDAGASLPHIVTIERNARLAQNVVDDLMALARGGVADAEPTPLFETLLAARVGMSGAIFVDDIAPAELCGRLHVGLATRLFHALYENAIAVATSGRAVVTTRARLEGAFVVIDVSDDGPGVPEALAPRIFEPLVTSRPGGTGLGLALARRIAAANGGTIELSATSPATFRITFPAA